MTADVGRGSIDPAPTPRRRILVLSPFPPRLDGRHGASRAIAELITALAPRHHVALACLRARDEPPADASLAAACEFVQETPRAGIARSSIRPWPRAIAVLPSLMRGKPLWVAARWNRRFARRVQEITESWQPDVVQAEFSAMAQYFSGLPRGRACRVTTLHEPGVLAARQQVTRSRGTRGIWRIDARLWERYERRALARSDAAVVFTSSDRSTLAALAGAARIAVIPLGTRVPATAADPCGTDPPYLLFVGNFLHPPNIDAVRFLLEEIFPPLRERYPALRLCLVGAGLPAKLVPRAAQGVVAQGAVADVWPYLDHAALVVAPLREGGGMRVKVLEAMAAGKAVVGTPLAMAGTGVEPGVHAMIASDATSFGTAIAALLDDPDRRIRMARAARDWVSRTLSWDHAAAAYEVVYEELLAERRRGAAAGVAGSS